MSQTANTDGEELNTEDWELVDEEIIHVELSGIFGEDLVKNPDLISKKFIGLDTSEPIVQLGNQVFSGKYCNTLGSSVFFQGERGRKSSTDPVFSKDISDRLEYFTKADKKIVLKRIFVNKK